jgi:hypothetical protein
MDVAEHERLSSITLRYKLKLRNSLWKERKWIDSDKTTGLLQIIDNRYHIMLYRTHLDGFELIFLVILCTICICRCKSNYHSVVVTWPLIQSPNEKGQQNKKKNNDLQNTTQKTKNRVTRTPLKTRVNSCVPEGLAVPASHVTTFEIWPFQTTPKDNNEK